MNYRTRKQITLVPSLIILKFPQSQNQAVEISCFATEFQKRNLGCLYREWKSALFGTLNGKQLHLGGILVWFPCLKIYPNCLSPLVESHWRVDLVHFGPSVEKVMIHPCSGKNAEWSFQNKRLATILLNMSSKGEDPVSSGQAREMNLRCKLQNQTHAIWLDSSLVG